MPEHMIPIQLEPHAWSGSGGLPPGISRRGRLAKGALLAPLVLLMSVVPGLAHAQYATRVVERNWTIECPLGKYGLEQVLIYPYNVRTTTVHLGDRQLVTRLRAGQVAAALLLPVGLILVGCCVGWGAIAKRQSAAPRSHTR